MIQHYDSPTLNEDYKPIDHTKEVCGDTNRPTPPDMRVPANGGGLCWTDKDGKYHVKVTKDEFASMNEPTKRFVNVMSKIEPINKYNYKMLDFILSDKTMWFTLSVNSHEAMIEALELFKDFDLNVSVEHDINSYEIVVRKPEWDDYD